MKFHPSQVSLDPTVKSMLFECPGCDMPHVIYVAGTGVPIWGFNGDMARPTVTPSVLVKWDQTDGPKVCHSFIKDGMIQFLGDCTHALAGQTVEIPEWED
jgi:hypothetical protein